MRPNGHILLSSLSTPSLLDFDPVSREAPTAVATFPNVTALLGSAPVGEDVFAFHAGDIVVETFSIARGSGAIFVVDMNSQPAKVLRSISIPNTVSLNGMAALPAHPHIVLSLDSSGGRVFRTNTQTGAVEVAFRNKDFKPSDNQNSVPVGANGLTIQGSTLYFTNSGKGFFARVPITDIGNLAGPIEKIHHINASLSRAYDDFDVDYDGNAYVGLHPHRLVKIAPDGTQTALRAGTGEDPVLYHPTSVKLSNDQKTAYVVTTPSGGEFEGGQIIAVDIS